MFENMHQNAATNVTFSYSGAQYDHWDPYANYVFITRLTSPLTADINTTRYQIDHLEVFSLFAPLRAPRRETTFENDVLSLSLSFGMVDVKSHRPTILPIIPKRIPPKVEPSMG